jgi:two-component system, OmpR family, response regulator
VRRTTSMGAATAGTSSATSPRFASRLPGRCESSAAALDCLALMDHRVLIVDDDHRLFELLRDYLGAHGVTALHAPDGMTSLRILESEPFDAVLLDIMMPGMDGLSTLRRIRQTRRIPVLMLTARGDETDRIIGLELGADDYLPKPFGPRELLARLRAVLRRSLPQSEGETLRVGGLRVDLDARSVRLGTELVELTALEFDLLVALMRRAGRVVPRGRLFELAGRGDTSVGDRTVDVHVSRLRKKLEDDPPRLIRTIRGVGYMLSKEEG